MALLQAIECLLLQEEEKAPGTVFNKSFIDRSTNGYDTFISHLQSLNLTELIERCGADPDQVNLAVEVLKNKNKIIACWAMGLTQHKNAVNTIKEIVNLLLLKGSIGKPGAGTCPVRGHSNVQGDRTMGIYENPSMAFLESIKNNFGFQPPVEKGLDVVESIKSMHDGKIKVFVAMGGNFLSATPDTQYTARAIQRCKLTVQISTKLNRSHLIHGNEAIILPCLARSDKDVQQSGEQFVSCENSMGVIQSSKGVLIPVSDLLLSEPAIVCNMAMATFGNRSNTRWQSYKDNYDLIRDDIEKTIPGFNNYNERVRIPGGFYLPNANRKGEFATSSSKANFNIAIAEKNELKENELMMMTIRSHDQFNTTIYGLNDRYRGIYNERRVILMNEADIAKLNFKDGESVDLYNYYGGIERVARNFIIVSYPVPRGCSATYFPETNVLVPIDSVAEKSNTPTSKLVVITLKKSD